MSRREKQLVRYSEAFRLQVVKELIKRVPTINAAAIFLSSAL